MEFDFKVATNFDVQAILGACIDREVEALSAIQPAAEAMLDIYAGGTQYYSLAQLKAMDHPFSIRHGTATSKMISRQSGVYRAGFQVGPPIIQANSVRLNLRMVSDRTKELDELLEGGTSRMVARPWRRFAYNQLKATMILELQKAFSKPLTIRMRR